MGGRDDGTTADTLREEQPDDRGPGAAVLPDGRLIGEHCCGTVGEGCGDGEATLLAALSALPLVVAAAALSIIWVGVLLLLPALTLASAWARLDRRRLRRWGIEDLVAEGRERWRSRTGPADLAALRARSRVTEAEALLLEAQLIKRFRPAYNVLLRDDKSFPNILVAKSHPFPQIKKHRGAKSEPGDYYGPFASAGAVNRTLNQLQRVFLLRSCTDATFSSRTRPCLLHQIKRCSAPCTGPMG